MKQIDVAKRLIADYFRREFGDDAVPDFSKLAKIGLAFTTFPEDTEAHTVQVNANLIAPSPYIATYIDGEFVRAETYESLADLNSELPYLTFDELVAVDENEKTVDELIADATGRSQSNTDCGREINTRRI